MNKAKDPKFFQRVYINEKNVNISYDGVENKGSRPYLVINPKVSQNNMIVAPITSLKSKHFGTSKTLRRSWFLWNEKSIIKLDHIFVISKKYIRTGDIDISNVIVIEPRYRKIIYKKIIMAYDPNNISGWKNR